jgi:cytochrome c peroxidase
MHVAWRITDDIGRNYANSKRTRENAMTRRLIKVLCSVAIILACAATAATVITGTGVAAIVGETRKVEIAQRSDPTIDQLRVEYRRPKFIPFPKDNPYTLEKASLGKKLFFDTRLSAANLLSCATCHNPAYGFGDGQPTGVGHGMKALGRRSPTIINAAYGLVFMWDGRAGSLEEQALGPIRADVEMNLPLDQLLERLKSIPEYGPLFEAAFPNQGIVPDAIAKAIATYERTVVSGRAPFDEWIDGDDKAISEEAKRGFLSFNTKAKCSSCHSGWNFTDDSFHDIGLPSEDIGRGKFLPEVLKMERAFKTPGLREITRRGPYMHDGAVKSLEAVVAHYVKGGIERPSRSELMKPVALSAQEQSDLIVFMKTLTSRVDPTAIPVLPR